MVRVVLTLWISVLRSSAALFRRREDQAIVELALRQQLAVYAHDRPRPGLSPFDRVFWVALSRLWPRCWSVTPSNVDQMNEITKTLDEGLREGAIGVGSTIGYAQKGITTYEMLEALRAAARYGRVTAVHHRFHPSASTPTEGPTGANEIILNAVLLDAAESLRELQTKWRCRQSVANSSLQLDP